MKKLADIQGSSRYALSFTSGALLMHEALVAAPLYLQTLDWRKVRQLIEGDNLLQTRTKASSTRLTREVIQRLSVLSDTELQILLNANTTERGQIMWVAACRRYELIGEFAEEVLRERYLLLATTLGYEDFDSFLRSKALWHEEISDLAISTVRKLRTNLFRMLIEADLLTSEGTIVAAELSPLLRQTFATDIRFFPTGGDS